MKKLFLATAAFACISTIAQNSFATTITTHITADDAYSVYISTNDALLGTLIGSNNSWYQAETYNATLTSGVTNYIHIVASDLYTVAVGMLADFTLSDNSFVFSNNTQNLVTNNTNWTGYVNGFGGTSGAIVYEGDNGVSPWGTIAGVSSDADWIWVSPVNNNHETRYFSSAIYANTPVPEPATMLLFGVGITGLAAFGRRKIR